MLKEVNQNNQLFNFFFLQIKLSVTEKLSSFYTEILSFIVQYSFIFDESPTKIKPLTPDPARDGSNWYGYAGQNPLIYVDSTGLSTTLDDFNYNTRTNDPDKSAKNQKKYNMQEYEYAIDNQGLTELGNMNYIYQKYNCQFYDDKNYLDRLNDDLSFIPEQYRKNAENQRYNDAYDFLFSCIMQSLVGTSYILGGNSRKGTDCSGSIILSLQEMGILVDDVTAYEMSSGMVQWILLLSSTNEKLAGNKGMLNFYKTGTSKRINHVNVGIGEIGIPKVYDSKYLGKKQIIDATEGKTMLCRNDGRLYLGQYNKVGAKQINQTYAPFSSETHPLIQGRINWAVLRNNRF